MLAKCANPSCSTPLVYLREGKIFMVEAPPQPPRLVAVESEGEPRQVFRIEHFWLCGLCAAHMTLAYDRQHGVQVVEKQFRVLRAAS